MARKAGKNTQTEVTTVSESNEGTTGTTTEGGQAQGPAELSDADRKATGATYKLNGKDVPAALVGKALRFPEAKTLAELREQCSEDNPDEHIRRAAQGAIDIVRQGRARALSASDEVGKILAGKAEGSEGLDDIGRVAMALEYIQGELDAWRYGSVVRGTGASAATKAEAADAQKIKQAAAADPELAAKLRAMGINLPGA